MPKERAQSWGDPTTHKLGTVTGSHGGLGDLYTLLANQLIWKFFCVERRGEKITEAWYKLGPASPAHATELSWAEGF